MTSASLNLGYFSIVLVVVSKLDDLCMQQVYTLHTQTHGGTTDAASECQLPVWRVEAEDMCGWPEHLCRRRHPVEWEGNRVSYNAKKM